MSGLVASLALIGGFIVVLVVLLIVARDRDLLAGPPVGWPLIRGTRCQARMSGLYRAGSSTGLPGPQRRTTAARTSRGSQSIARGPMAHKGRPGAVSLRTV